MQRGPFAALEQLRHILHPHPLAALPLHDAELPALPGHPALAGQVRRGLGAQGGDHLAGDPLAQATVLGVVEVDLEQLADGALADQQQGFHRALVVLHALVAPLVRVQLAGQLVVDMAVGERAEVAGDDPGLVIDEQRAQRAVVAVEDAGNEIVVGHDETPSLQGSRHLILVA